MAARWTCPGTRGCWTAARAPASALVCSRRADLSLMAGGRRRPSHRRSSAGCAFPRLGGSSSSSSRPAKAFRGKRSAGLLGDSAPMGSGEAGEICRLALMGALPSIAEGDIAGFGAALTRIQRLLGDYFAPAQGGRRFASPDVAGVLDCLRNKGPTASARARGVRQASRFASDARLGGTPGGCGAPMRERASSGHPRRFRAESRRGNHRLGCAGRLGRDRSRPRKGGGRWRTRTSCIC